MSSEAHNTPIPELRLSQGQVLWALCEGQTPTELIEDQFRYLRQVGIPFSPGELGRGRGNRLFYGFDELIESGAALFGLKQGLKPREVATLLVGNRAEFREQYRQAFRSQPPDRIHAPWVRSRGAQRTLLVNPCFMHIHDRYSETPLEYEIIINDDHGVTDAEPLDTVALYRDGKGRVMFPLTEKVLVWVAWALEAPEIRPGRK